MVKILPECVTGPEQGRSSGRISAFSLWTGIFPNWQKESWQTFEETSGYVRPERVNKWPNSMTYMMMMIVYFKHNGMSSTKEILQLLTVSL